MRKELMSMTKTQLNNELRSKWTKLLFDFLESKGEDVGLIKDNVFNFPVLDSEGNEKEIEITVKVPKGSTKDNEPYDLYGLRQEFELKKEQTRIKNEKRAKEKEAKIARDKAFREKQKLQKERATQ